MGFTVTSTKVRGSGIEYQATLNMNRVKRSNDMAFDKQVVIKVRDDLNEHLSTFFKAGLPDLEFHVGNASYRDDRITFKLEVKIAGSESTEMKDLRACADLYQLDLDKVHDTYTLGGYRKRARKNPFIVNCSKTEKNYVITHDVAVRWFGKESADV
jgi:hypothetical protein